jgi:alcohol dehydrogenase class IV
MDALSHAFESYASNASSPLTDLCALEAARLIFSTLPQAYEDPLRLQHREMLMLGGMYAGLAFSNASLGLVHAMAHSIGGFYNASHGEITGALLGMVVEFNYPAAPEKYDALEKAVSGKGGQGAENLVGELQDLRRRLGADRGLRHLGVREEDIPALSRNTLKDPSLATNPRHVTMKDVEGLYGRAL